MNFNPNYEELPQGDEEVHDEVQSSSLSAISMKGVRELIYDLHISFMIFPFP
jgi:hypothetical protein